MYKFLNPRSLFERASFVVICIVLVLIGVFQGLQIRNYTIDLFFVVLEVFWLDAFFSSAVFVSFMALSSLLFFNKLWRGKDISSDYQPSLTCIIPNYYDGSVVDRAVKSILDADYSNLEVVVVCVEGDEKSLNKMENFSDEDRFSYFVKDEDKSSKAENINYALNKTSSEAVAIFDADQIIHKDFFKRNVKYLEDFDVVQGRHLPTSKSIVGQMAYYEAILFVYILRQLSYLLTSFRLAGSNSMIVKRKVFDKIGLYDKRMLTEDFDFTHRCFKNGIKVKSTLYPPTKTEAANNWADWWGQRKRWMTGYLQVILKLTKKLFTDFKGYRSIISLIIAISSLFGSFFMLIIVSKFILILLLDLRIIYFSPLIFIILISFIGRYHDYRNNNIDSIGLGWISTPFMFPLFSLATIKAFSEFITMKEIKWYKVDK